MKRSIFTFAILSLMFLGSAVASPFDPEPNDPPRRTGGSGTRLEKIGTADSPDKCPEGTTVALPNDSGGVDCYR